MLYQLFLAQDFTAQSFLQSIRSALVKMSQDFAAFIPNLLLAAVLLFLGIIFAKIIRKVIATTFEKLGIDALFERSGLTSILQRAGINASPGSFLAKILFWLIILFTVKIAAQEASIKDISNIIVSIIGFMPNVITASLILLVGFIVADIVKNSSFTSLNTMGLSYAKTLSKILFFFIFILVLTVALAKVNIKTELLNASVKIILASLGLALSISLGLGLKDFAKSIVSGVYSKDIYSQGTTIEWEGKLYTIAGTGPITTKLTNKEGQFIIIPNEYLTSQPVRGFLKEPPTQ